jgi:hypothetical protein
VHPGFLLVGVLPGAFLATFLAAFLRLPPSNFRISGPSSYPSVRRTFHGKPKINMRRLKDFADHWLHASHMFCRWIVCHPVC